MAKKRKCRYTPEELRIHEQAVRIRKLTDAQLVEAFNNAHKNTPENCPRMPQNGTETDKATNDTDAINKLLQAISDGQCKGVKSKTAYKIEELAKELGLIA